MFSSVNSQLDGIFAVSELSWCLLFLLMASSAEITREHDLKDKDSSENGQNSTMFSSKPPKYQENGTEESWSKSLENLPIFTRKHIGLHRDNVERRNLKEAELYQ